MEGDQEFMPMTLGRPFPSLQSECPFMSLLGMGRNGLPVAPQGDP